MSDEARMDAVLAMWVGGWDDRSPLGDDDPLTTLWWSASQEVDDRVREALGADHAAAAAGALDRWAATPRGSLALVILLDQVPRNIHRGTPGAHATDARALAVATAAVDAGHDQVLAPIERAFLYMPFMHAEDLEAQQRSVTLYEGLAADTVGLARGGYFAGVAEFARKHLAVVERFGRFPSRNESLGRASTPAEVIFLQTEGRGF